MTEETVFYSRAEQWLMRVLEQNPVAATHLGDHRWDDRLGDYRIEAMDQRHREMVDALHEFQAMETDDYSLAADIDHTLIVKVLSSLVREYEKIQGHRRNPGGYLSEALGGIVTLLLKEFAPLPDRLESALGRTREVPRVLEEARLNLVADQVPRVWAETMLEQARQAPGLFLALLPATAAEAAPDLQDAFAESGPAAAQAVQAYGAYVEEEILPRATDEFGAGRELFDELLHETHLVDYDADELLETGWELFRKTQEQMELVSQEIDPHRSVRDILEAAKADHPAPEELLDAYRQAMAESRQYVIDHDIVSIPEGESLRIVETPPYLRPIIPYAAYMAPGILEEKQDGIFLVTPVDPEAPAEAQEEKLKGHFWAKLPITALHEAYPGHHLQLVWANRSPSLPRRMGSFLSTLFVEGWAFYCEELLEQLGYIAAPVQRLGRLSDQLWRAARIVLDVSLHTRGMTIDEGVQFLVEKCQLEPTNALAEVRRYAETPTQPQSYLMGKLAIVELVEDYRAAHPDATLRVVHDAILSSGSLPPRLMRRQLGLD